MVFLFFIFLGQTTCLLEDDQKSGRFVWGSLWTKEELKITQGESGSTERGPSAQGVWPNLWRTVFNILAMLTRYSIWDCKSLFPTIFLRDVVWVRRKIEVAIRKTGFISEMTLLKYDTVCIKLLSKNEIFKLQLLLVHNTLVLKKITWLWFIIIKHEHEFT